MKSLLNENSAMKKLLIILTISMSPIILFAQENEITSEKIPLTLKLYFYKKADSRKIVTTTLTKELKNKKEPAVDIKVSFYVKGPSAQVFLEDVYTDFEGKASVEANKNLPRDEKGMTTILARVQGDSLYEGAENQVSVKEANLILSLSEMDTLRLVIARLTQVEPDGRETPVPEIEVKFYVQRLFGVMPLGEEYAVSTDDNGEASPQFPQGIPGDEQRSLTIVARVEGHELFGNVEAKVDAKWGVPVPIEKDPFPPALWEPQAPIQMIITFSILFGGVWITYSFVFYQLFKIRKEPREETQYET